MKTIWKYLGAIALAALAAVAVTGCSQWDIPYESLDEQGYTVSVRFDANGGVFAATENVSVVDVYSLSNYTPNADGQVELRLLTPDDAARKEKAFPVSNTNYMFVGWYTERMPRVNEAGEPLDEYGERTAVSGRPQGYMYDGKWDFENDRLVVDANGTYTSTETVLTLYAAWVPYFRFEFYEVDADGVAAATPYAELQTLKLTAPVWNESTGKLDTHNFPVPKDRDCTFETAYLDAAMTQVMPDTLCGVVDEEHAVIVSGGTTKIYTTWLEGTWLHIYTAKQLFSLANPGYHYELCADLDFTDEMWPTALSTGTFTGTIRGDGHVIRNVTVLQGDNSKINGGLFGVLGEAATLTDVTFENATLRIVAGSRMQGPNYGLLAGTVQSGATLTGVSVSGTIEIGKSCYRPNDYNIGLLVGVGEVSGIDHTGITCTVEEPDNNTARVEVDPVTGAVTLTFAE